jgi:hypothetical protein
MTQRLDRLSFSRSAAVAMIGFGMLSAALAGCASTTMGNVVPTPKASGQVGTASSQSAAANPALSGAPRNTGTYPNLNIPPKAAADQISPDEKTADTAALQAAQQAKAALAAGEAPTDPALLRKLAETHSADALKEIEEK